MEFTTQSKSMTQHKQQTLTAEQPLSWDVLLPDYYPDISRILNCRVTAQTTAVNPRGDKVNIEGMAKAEVIYQDQDATLQGASYKIPFNKTITVSQENPKVHVEIRSATPICKAINRRRMEVSSTITLVTHLDYLEEVDVLWNASGENLQTLTHTFPSLTKLPMVEKTVHLKESIPLPQTLISPVKIITTKGVPRIKEIKPSGSRVIVKGELDLWMLVVQGENKELSVLPHCLSWSCLAEGKEESQYTGTVQVQEIETTYEGEYAPEDNNFTVSATLALQLQGYKHQPCTYISDCYCPTRPLELQYRTLDIYTPTSNEMLEPSWQEEGVFHLPEEMEKPLFLSFSPQFALTTPQEEGIGVNLRGILSIMGQEKEGGYSWCERQWDIAHNLKLPQGEGQSTYNPTFTLQDLQWSNRQDQLKVKGRIELTGLPLETRAITALSSLTVDEDGIPSHISSGLTIYYGHTGESLWDIAKSYNSSIALIQEENELKEDFLSLARPLIIPSL